MSGDLADLQPRQPVATANVKPTRLLRLIPGAFGERVQLKSV
jgi:hypothetical protein